MLDHITCPALEELYLHPGQRGIDDVLVALSDFLRRSMSGALETLLLLLDDFWRDTAPLLEVLTLTPCLRTLKIGWKRI